MPLQTADRTRTAAAPLRAFVPDPPDPDRETDARSTARDRYRIGGMSLSRFSSAGLVLRVRSRLLGEDVLFASDNAKIDARQDLAVYRAAELERLLRGSQAELMALHTAKGLQP